MMYQHFFINQDTPTSIISQKVWSLANYRGYPVYKDLKSKFSHGIKHVETK